MRREEGVHIGRGLPYTKWAPTVRPIFEHMILCEPLKRRFRFLPERERASPSPGPPGSDDVYVNIPFCATKCSFCGIPTWDTKMGKPLFERYLRALNREMEQCQGLPGVQEGSFGTFYVGGGTASLLDAAQLGVLVRALLTGFPSKDASVTVEGNALNFTSRKLAAVKEAGASRVSIGVQSFDPVLMERLKLPHTRKRVEQFMEEAREAGFSDINVDIIFGIPGESVDSLTSSIDIAMALKPTSIAFYDLLLDPHVPLSRDIREGLVDPLPDPAGYLRRLELIENVISARGGHPLWSNTYAMPGSTENKPSVSPSGRGNLVGLGAGAYGHIGDFHHVNVTSVMRYMDTIEAGRSPVWEARVTRTPEERAQHELINFGFYHSLDRRDFVRRVGKDVMEIAGRRVEKLCGQGLLESDSDRLWFTPLGRLWAGNVTRDLLGRRHGARRQFFAARNTMFSRLPEEVQNFMLKKAGRR